MTETVYEWVTTATNPRTPSTGHDAGVTGWKLHAIPNRTLDEDCAAFKRRRALCGLMPRHGWGLDLFIDDKCARCQSVMDRRKKLGETFTELVYPKKSYLDDE